MNDKPIRLITHYLSERIRQQRRCDLWYGMVDAEACIVDENAGVQFVLADSGNDQGHAGAEGLLDCAVAAVCD